MFPGYFQVKDVQNWYIIAAESNDVHWENYISISCHIDWDMNVVTVFFSILYQMDFHLVQIERKTVTTIISQSLWQEMET